MAEKIKNFFKKKKSDAKFKLAGPGHKLTESTTSYDKPATKNQYTVKPRNNLSEEARRAAEAAEARLQSKQQQDKNFNTSFAAIQAQVKRELEAEKKATNERKSSQSPVLNRAKSSDTEIEISPVLAVNGVYFKCPMVGPEILSKEEWRTKIREFLYAQLEFEQGLTAALMIHNLNKNREKVSFTKFSMLSLNLLKNKSGNFFLILDFNLCRYTMQIFRKYSKQSNRRKISTNSNEQQSIQ